MKRMKFKYFCVLVLLQGLTSLLLAGETNIERTLPAQFPVQYDNAEYGLTFPLPASWKGYSVQLEKWNSNQPEIVPPVSGPMIVLRHPQWKTNDMYQDIPIMVFTRKQWDDLNAGKFDAAGAGGIIEELWHNEKYVFGLHSRYNALDEVKDWKEVGEIVRKNCAAHPAAHLYPQ